MTIQDAIRVLRAHNAWRRNNELSDVKVEQQNPTDIGIAIDTVCNALEPKTHRDWEDALNGFIYTCIMNQDNEKFHDIIRAEGWDLFNMAKRIIANDLGGSDEEHPKDKETDSMRFQVANSALQGILEAKHGIVGEIVPSLLVADALRIADEFIKQWNGE